MKILYIYDDQKFFIGKCVVENDMDIPNSTENGVDAGLGKVYDKSNDGWRSSTTEEMQSYLENQERTPTIDEKVQASQLLTAKIATALITKGILSPNDIN